MEYDHNTVLEDIGSDFINMLTAKDWGGARAVIDNLFDLGFDDEAYKLGKDFINAQFQSVK